MGLVKSGASPKEIQTVNEILFSHFGASRDESSIKFSMAAFQLSFKKLFDYLHANGIRLSSDFVFFGMCLVGLYRSLEALDVPLPVKESYDLSLGAKAEDLAI